MQVAVRFRVDARAVVLRCRSGVGSAEAVRVHEPSDASGASAVCTCKAMDEHASSSVDRLLDEAHNWREEVADCGCKLLILHGVSSGQSFDPPHLTQWSNALGVVQTDAMSGRCRHGFSPLLDGKIEVADAWLNIE